MTMRPFARIATTIFSGLLLLATGAQAPTSAAADAPRESQYRLGAIGAVSLYRPVGEPRATALFLSGDAGWNAGTAAIARDLSRRGVLVAGLSTPAVMHALEGGHSRCINPNYMLMNLARDVQHRAGVHAYSKPLLIGYSAGATLAYGALAQWPNGGYRGVFSLGFSADITGKRAWCQTPGFAAKPIVRPAHGWLFAPNRRITIPWIVLQGGRDQVVPFAPARRFTESVPHARLIALPTVDHGFTDHRLWMPQMAAAMAPMLDPVRHAGGDGLGDMPITLVPATGSGGRRDTMAVLYSGDGGWVGIDRDVAAHLAAKGIPVVGIDSLSYFWSARTPQGAGADLKRIITSYSGRWHRPRVLLVGYSFGADILPATVSMLDSATRARIASLSLMGLSDTADFQFHLSSWLNLSSDEQQPTIPAVSRLRGMDIRCVQGDQENDSACPLIPRGIARHIMVPGGHHFNRNTALLAAIVST